VAIERDQSGNFISASHVSGMRSYAGLLNQIREERRRTDDIAETTPEEPGSRISDDEERTTSILSLAELTEHSLWEGVNGRHTSARRFVTGLNSEVLARYNLHVDVKPVDVNASMQDHESSNDVQERLKRLKEIQGDK
jgi:hypothetical protein